MAKNIKLFSSLFTISLVFSMATISSCSNHPAGSRPTEMPSSTPTIRPTETSLPTATSTPPEPIPLGMPGKWKLVFADEFDGTALNLADWCPSWVDGSSCEQITTPVNMSELAAYDPAQVSISDGLLHLTLIDKPVTIGDHTFPYRSGMVQTSGKENQPPKHQFTFGAFEARIFLPGTNGKIQNWPAWWTDGQNWPADGEMDIMEGIKGSAQYHFYSNLTKGGGGPAGDYTGWHTYGADWEKGKVTYYYDSVPVGVLDEGITDSPMYLVLNYTTDQCCSWEIVAPATMLVDYVRVWQH